MWFRKHFALWVLSILHTTVDEPGRLSNCCKGIFLVAGRLPPSTLVSIYRVDQSSDFQGILDKFENQAA
jgi:hypothetical protein